MSFMTLLMSFSLIGKLAGSRILVVTISTPVKRVEALTGKMSRVR